MTKNDEAIFKNFVVSREFDALKRLSEEMVENWIRQLPVGGTEYEYLKASFERDGKIMGIKALLNECQRVYDR